MQGRVEMARYKSLFTIANNIDYTISYILTIKHKSMEASQKVIVPRYIGYFFIVSNVILTCIILLSGSLIISPLLAAFIIAILLNPLYNILQDIGLPRILSAAIAVFAFFLVIAILLSFITTQLKFISSDPALSADNLSGMISSSQNLISKLGMSLSDQTKLIDESLNNFVKSTFNYVPNVFSVTANYLSMFLLFFMSLFFFLYYRGFFINFVFKLFSEESHKKIAKTVDKIEIAVKNYIVGLFFVILIVAILNSIGLMFLGLPHALFFGILAALLTIIPYIGILIGSLIPALFALVATDSLWYPVIVIFIFSFVQFLEGNFITPNIIGSRENINPYVAILGLFIGGMLLGAVGVVLAIPILGIIKIICDDIRSMKPIGYVMGNPKQEKSKFMQTIDKLLIRLGLKK